MSERGPKMDVICDGCARVFERLVRHYEKNVAAGKPNYCTRACSNKHSSNPAAMRAAGLRRTAGGSGKNYPRFHGRRMHRVVAEEKLGRPLLPGEVVHHINGDKHDNRPENLEVLPSQAEHVRLHSRSDRKQEVA